MARIVAEHHRGHWSAHFADAPLVTYGGSDPATAVRRLPASAPELDLDETTIAADSDASTGQRMEFTVRPRTGSGCPGCGGTSRYVGL